MTRATFFSNILILSGLIFFFKIKVNIGTDWRCQKPEATCVCLTPIEHELDCTTALPLNNTNTAIWKIILDCNLAHYWSEYGITCLCPYYHPHVVSRLCIYRTSISHIYLRTRRKTNNPTVTRIIDLNSTFFQTSFLHIGISLILAFVYTPNEIN